MFFAPLPSAILLIAFRGFQIALDKKYLFFVVLMQCILVCEIAISQLHVDHFEVAQPQKEIVFEKTFEGLCTEGKNWQVVGTNSVFAPKSNKNNSYLIDIQKTYCSSLHMYTNPTATFVNSWNLVQQLPKYPTLIHFGSQDLLTIRTRSDLHPFLQSMSQFSNILHVLNAISTRKGSSESRQTLLKKLQPTIEDASRPLLLILDVVQANYSDNFSELQKEINQIAEEHPHISTIDTVALFTDEQRDQILSDDFTLSSQGHQIMRSKVESSLTGWLQIHTSSD